MKKINRRLKLVTQTIRTLDTQRLTAGGAFPTETEKASGCVVTFHSCDSCNLACTPSKLL